MQAMGSEAEEHLLLLCGLVPNRPRTGAWGPLLYTLPPTLPSAPAPPFLADVSSCKFSVGALYQLTPSPFLPSFNSHHSAQTAHQSILQSSFSLTLCEITSTSPSFLKPSLPLSFNFLIAHLCADFSSSLAASFPISPCRFTPRMQSTAFWLSLPIPDSVP